MTRSNQDRIGANVPVGAPTRAQGPPEIGSHSRANDNPLHFIVPTEIVDLPSKGQFYEEGHPLHNCESMEIRHMTAKEEDILTTASYLKKGIALDKVLQNVIVDKKIKVEDLLIGDKNALLVYSRMFGYGNDYTTSLECLSCGKKFTYSFDLSSFSHKDYAEDMKRYNVELTPQNTFLITLPRSQAAVEFRLLLSRDEKRLTSNQKGLGSLELLESIIVSINDQNDRIYIKRTISNLPILDATVLKGVYGKIMPDVDLTQQVECEHCGEESEMGVPLDAGFFWPDI